MNQFYPKKIIVYQTFDLCFWILRAFLYFIEKATKTRFDFKWFQSLLKLQNYLVEIIRKIWISKLQLMIIKHIKQRYFNSSLAWFFYILTLFPYHFKFKSQTIMCSTIAEHMRTHSRLMGTPMERLAEPNSELYFQFFGNQLIPKIETCSHEQIQVSWHY